MAVRRRLKQRLSRSSRLLALFLFPNINIGLVISTPGHHEDYAEVRCVSGLTRFKDLLGNVP